MLDLVPDTERVRAFLRERCSLDLVDRLELTYLKVKPDGGGGRFLYEARDARRPTLRVSASYVRNGAGQGRDLPAEPAPARSALYAEDLHLLFQVFPADRALPSLVTLTDVAALPSILQATLARDVLGAAVRDVAVEVLRYKPERKCVLRYDVVWANGTGLPSVVYAKVVRPSDFARTSRLVPSRPKSAAVSTFELPARLGVLPQLGAELHSQVRGVALSLLAEDREFPRMCRRVGRALQAFHGTRAAAAPRRTVEATVAQLDRASSELALLLPSAAARVELLRGRLASRLRHRRRHRACLIHGDFHGDNVLVHPGGLGLVDLEDCARGDPAQDLGSMWAQLQWLSVKTGKPQSLAEARRAFLDGYADSGGDVAGEVVEAQAALHCFLFACQHLRHRPARAEDGHARELLAVCEDILEHGLP